MTSRDRAIIAALNFAGLTISTADGTYDNLITVIQDAIEGCAKSRAEKTRAACLEIVKAWIAPDSVEIGSQRWSESRIAKKIAHKIETIGGQE